METLIAIDEKLFLLINNSGSETWDGFWMFITNQWYAFPLYGLLALLILWKTGFKSAVVSGFMIIATVIFTIGISHAFKYGVARPRPCNIFEIGEQMRFPLEAIGKECGSFGFVSTHASVAMALIMLCALILKEHFKFILYPLLVWVVLFSYSRIYLGKHYPGDIIVGLLVGLIIGVLAYKLREFIGKKLKV